MIRANSVVLSVVMFIAFLQFLYHSDLLSKSRRGPVVKWNRAQHLFDGVLPGVFSGRRALALTPASNQVVYQDDHCNHYQDVNQVATDVTDETQ